mmetsp:Transcript_29026/g.61594  ORF Transcript_29026/g.61594 Transcript_29026/m.61594 type:complete len:108 (+) Transcript_29026:91-414(+)
MATPATALLLFVALLRRVRVDAQPTLNREMPEHGPNDRFTEGTRIQAMFNDIDLNGDKKLDEHEVHMYFQKLGASQVSDGLWEREDRNGDGVIELHEFVRGDTTEEL